MDDERESADTDDDPDADDSDTVSDSPTEPEPDSPSSTTSNESANPDETPDAETEDTTDQSSPPADNTPPPETESTDQPPAEATEHDQPADQDPDSPDIEATDTAGTQSSDSALVNPEVASAAIDGKLDPGEDSEQEDLSGPIDYGQNDPDDATPASAGSRYMGGPSWKGPGDDEEMPLAAHIEEMLKRLAIVVAVAGVVSLLTFPAADSFLNLLWNSILPQGEFTRPRLYGILELKLTELKVASLAGLVIALPVFVYQTYKFMRPGLYPHERRYYLAAIPTSLVLAFIGISFAYFIILPAIFTYFLYYSQDVATIGFGLGKTFDLILLLMGYMAIVFQIPLFILLAMMMNLVTRRWLADRRLIFWGAFLGISFIFSPDPTGMAPIVVAITMIALFEGTLFLVKWTRRGRDRAKQSS